eukprot:1161204-Pelagomonas_calceolata.AAC.1
MSGQSCLQTSGAHDYQGPPTLAAAEKAAAHGLGSCRIELATTSDPIVAPGKQSNWHPCDLASYAVPLLWPDFLIGALTSYAAPLLWPYFLIGALTSYAAPLLWPYFLVGALTSCAAPLVAYRPHS